jgi:hypothetical protein
MLDRVRAWYNVRNPPKQGWIALVTLGLAFTWGGGIYGIMTYVDDKHEESERTSAIIQQQALQAKYQAELNTYNRCVQRVEGRDQVRGVFEEIFLLIDEMNPDNTFSTDARAALDNNFPALDIAECGEEPEFPPIGIEVAQLEGEG